MEHEILNENYEKCLYIEFNRWIKTHKNNLLWYCINLYEKTREMYELYYDIMSYINLYSWAIYMNQTINDRIIWSLWKYMMEWLLWLSESYNWYSFFDIYDTKVCINPMCTYCFSLLHFTIMNGSGFNCIWYVMCVHN